MSDDDDEMKKHVTLIQVYNGDDDTKMEKSENLFTTIKCIHDCIVTHPDVKNYAYIDMHMKDKVEAIENAVEKDCIVLLNVGTYFGKRKGDGDDDDDINKREGLNVLVSVIENVIESDQVYVEDTFHLVIVEQVAVTENGFVLNVMERNERMEVVNVYSNVIEVEEEK